MGTQSQETGQEAFGTCLNGMGSKPSCKFVLPVRKLLALHASELNDIELKKVKYVNCKTRCCKFWHSQSPLAVVEFCKSWESCCIPVAPETQPFGNKLWCKCNLYCYIRLAKSQADVSLLCTVILKFSTVSQSFY